MRVLVLAPLRGAADFALDDPWKRPIRFEHATFDQTMANVGPHVVLDHKTRAERHFRKLQDFADVLPGAGGGQTKGGSLLDDMLSEAEGTADVKHPVAGALERAWRGLAFLCSHAPEGVTIDAIDAAHDEVSTVLGRIAGTPAEAPIDLVVIDHAIQPTERDLERVLQWAELGEGLGAPVICGGTPALVGIDDLAALARSERRLRSSDDPRAVRFRSVTAKDPMRWLALALNGTTSANAPYVLAALATEAAARTGWAAALGRSTLDVDLEARPTDDAASEAAAAGLVLLTGGRLPHEKAPVAYREPSRSGGNAAAASLGLGDQLFLSRVYRLVQELGAAIPQGTPENVVRETALVALNDLFAETTGPKPSFDVSLTRGGLAVTVRPRSFGGITLEEATLGAPLG